MVLQVDFAVHVYHVRWVMLLPMNQGTPGVLVTFLSADQSVAAESMTSVQRDNMVLDGLAKYFGSEARSATAVVACDWSQEEWTRGGYCCTYGVGGVVRQGPDRAVPVGPLHWACTDIAGVGNMHMEGAIRSGRAAVAAIARELQTTSTLAFKSGQVTEAAAGSKGRTSKL
jgi:putrescine oxidase